jgi:dTDP-glucose 4,6-dehydratase
VKGDINDAPLMSRLLEEYEPSVVFNLAAESHVDKSIDSPSDFIQTNIVGTFSLLEAARGYHEKTGSRNGTFRFIHVSTDEVFGSLSTGESPFTEVSPYKPNSPYSASKASSDHLVMAYNSTYTFPSIVTNCSNNYGSYQFPEKLIPMMIECALSEKPLPVYGDGLNVRDWLHVADHCRALLEIALNGNAGQRYNIGGRCEKTNLEVVKEICGALDDINPRKNGKSYGDLVSFVRDRPGHDRRYAVDCGKIEKELGWRPEETFSKGIRETVQWYLKNRDWVRAIFDGSYRLERQGVGSHE